MPTDFLGRVMVVFNRYGMSMLQGAGVSLKIALVGTLVGCLIGFAVGIVQTIPSEKGDNHLKKVPVLDKGEIVGVVNRSDITLYSMRTYLKAQHDL